MSSSSFPASPAQGAALWLAAWLVCLSVFFPGLRGDAWWDDRPKVFSHPAVSAPDGLAQLWLRGGWRNEEWPVTQTLFWVQHRLFGETRIAYRMVNLALHAANAVLTLLILRRVDVPGASFVAAAWMLHPVQAETVLWITEFKTVWAWALALGACGLFVKSRDQGGRGTAVSLLLWTVACFSKSAFVAFPLLWPWLFERRTTGLWPRVRSVLPHLAVSAAAALWTLHVSAGQVHPGVFEGPEGAARLAAPSLAFLFYACKAWLPTGLSLVYPHHAAWLNANGAQVWLPTLLLAGLVAAGWSIGRGRWRPVVLSMLAGALLLLPVSGLFAMPYMMHSLVADHFQYAALLPFLALGPVAWTCAGQVGPAPRIARLAGSAALTLLAGLSLLRSHALRDARSMWEDTLEKNPSAWVAHNNLGALIADEALQDFEQAAFLARDLAELEQQRTRLAFSPGQEQALARIEREIDARRRLQADAAARGRERIAGALPHLETAIAMKPGNDAARHVMANACVRLNRPQDALRLYAEAVEIDRRKIAKNRDPSLLINASTLLRATGNPAEADALIREALSLRPDMRLVIEAAEYYGVRPATP